MTLILVDWVTLLSELRHAGFNTSQVAARTKIPRSTVDCYRQGTSSPSHPNGELLIEFWMLVTSKPRADLPVAKQVALNIGLMPKTL